MALVVISKSPDNVVDLQRVKRWLRIDNPDEDDRVQFLLQAATEYVEKHSRMVFSATVYQLTLDAFPAVNWYQYYPVMAPFPQLLTLGLNFFLPNQTINLDFFPVTAIADGRLAPAAQQVWPYAKNQLDAVTIQIEAGFGTGNVPNELQMAILNHCLLAYMNPGGIPAADLDNLNKAIEGNRRNLLV